MADEGLEGLFGGGYSEDVQEIRGFDAAHRPGQTPESLNHPSRDCVKRSTGLYSDLSALDPLLTKSEQGVVVPRLHRHRDLGE